MSRQSDAFLSDQNRDHHSDHVDNEYDEEDVSGDASRLLPESDLIVEQIRNELASDLAGADMYTRQSLIVNRALRDMGMGRYQWELFVLCGAGWLFDDLWLVGLALSLPSLSTEFGLDANAVRYTTMALFFGMGCGSVVWGSLSDSLGRRIAFNSTLLITGVFGVMIAFGPTWSITAFLFSAMGFGVGGALPVDGMLFLEFLPSANTRLLTLLSAW